MSIFISEAELQAAGGDVSLVVERADRYIRDILQQLEAHKARADAATITAEQRCSVVEQKFLAMSSRCKDMDSTRTQLENTLQSRSEELSQAQTQIHKLELEAMKKDSDMERILCELNEMRKARRELLEVVEQKNTELNEKNTYIKMYLDKIVFLTDERSNLEGKLRESEAEMTRSQVAQARLLQEKDLLEQHNAWLNEELTEKVNTLLKEKRASSDMDMEMRSKLAMAEQACKETGESLQRTKEQMKDLELRLNQTREELKFTKENAENKENHLSLELETATKLIELYKQGSEEWSKKAIDLEGVIKALEAHLNEVEAESKDHLQNEIGMRKNAEKDALEAKEKIDKLEKEVESLKKAKDEESLFFSSNFSNRDSKGHDVSDQELSLELQELHHDTAIVPIVPAGISGTALAATLLRDGWSITKLYVKYQEAVDAWRHERQERMHSQALLQRVLQEIEQRAGQILDERAEHARMAEAYAVLEEKLHFSIEEQSLLENQIIESKAELRKRERDLNSMKQECSDLQYQVTTLLKECADLKQQTFDDNASLQVTVVNKEPISARTASDVLISQQLVTFKDIHEIVQQNTQLRAIARSLSQQNEERERELKEAFDLQLKKRTDEAAQKVATVLRKSEEQTQIISSLQGTVGMYKRLYEEELRSRSGSGALYKETRITATTENGSDDVQRLVLKSEEEIEKVRKDASDRLSVLEEELRKARQDANMVRIERDHLIVEGTYTREQLQRILQDSEDKRKEMDAVLARNVEFSQIITDYQRRLRENGEHVQSVEEKCRRLSIEVNVLEREKELISNAEKRASQELSSLSDRVHRLQATLDNLHTVEEAQESMRAAEKKRIEDENNRMQKEWVEMKHELDSERTHVRHLMNERDLAVKQTMDRIESLNKELTEALNKASMMEARSLVAEARCAELESTVKKTEEKISLMTSRKEVVKDMKDIDFEMDSDVLSMLEQAKEEVDRLKEELDASERHVSQYKKLAQSNEEALIRMEDAHNRYKEEAEKMKESLETELTSLRVKVGELEKSIMSKENDLLEAEKNREIALSTAEKDLALLRESEFGKRMLLEQAEERIKALKIEVEKEHQLWRSAQTNYERQVLLQADTIRELTISSGFNVKLEKEVTELREKLALAVSELESSRISWDMEKESLSSESESLMNKLRELDEQNRILLDRIEAVHTRTAEKDRISGENLKSLDHTENDLQDVIRYLRRSKETSDMEISLLKQERTRLQKQLEAALHAADEAQTNLRREQENARVKLCSEEEFKSLQAQVREMTLLRESNEQLRMENKRNFEECQTLNQKLQKEQTEIESLKSLLTAQEVELEAAIKNVDLQKAEVARWENRVSQLLQKYKSFDIEDYKRIQSELISSQESLMLEKSNLETTKKELEKLDTTVKELNKLQEVVQNLETEISSKDEKVAGLEKQLKDAEATSKTEIEKLRRQCVLQRRKIDLITKEKDDTAKQLEELKANSSKRGIGESHRTEAQIRQELASQHEQAQKEFENLIKEKEARIQTLERTLEREREDLKKEKEEHRKERVKRQRNEKTYYEFAQKQDQERKTLLEELSALRREKENSEEKQQKMMEEEKREKENSERLLEEVSALKHEKDNSENVQAKKMGRRIVRPKIESPAETQAGESGTELVAETEAETEMRDSSRIEPSTEVIEIVNTTSAIVVASTVGLDEVISIRKRSSTQTAEETSITQSFKEASPAYKKQKGLDSKSLVECETVQIVAESFVASGEMDVENASPVTTTEAPSTSEATENNQDVQPISRSESTVPKRPRILRPDTLAITTAPKDDVAEVSEEKNAALEVEPSSEAAAVEQSLIVPVDNLGTCSQGQPSSPEKKENMEVSPSTDIAQDVLQSELDGVQKSVIDLNAITDALLPDSKGNLSSVELESEQGILEAPSTDSGVDIEDGEIEPDDVEQNIIEVSRSLSVNISDENKTNLSSDAAEKDAQLRDETENDEKATNQSSTSKNTENVSDPTPIRQARKVTSLPERRERLLGRRAAIPPPSPGRRNTRSSKRSLGAQGRFNVAPDGSSESQDITPDVSKQSGSGSHASAPGNEGE